MNAHQGVSSGIPAETLDFIARNAEPMWSRPQFMSDRDDSAAGSRRERWIRTAAGGDRLRFRARLAMCGLSEKDAARWVATPPAARDWDPDPDVAWRAFLAALSFHYDKRAPQRAGSEVAFGECFDPFIEAARALIDRRLAAEEISGANLVPTLLDGLRRRLSDTAAPVLQHRFSMFRELRAPAMLGEGARAGSALYRRFCARLAGGQWSAVLRDFPCLARLLGQVCADGIDAIVALLAHLDSDRSELERLFAAGEALGSPVEIRPGLSDPHDGGRTVALVAFESGIRLVYKPRDIGTEWAFNRLLARLNALGARPAFRVVRVLPRGGHGWAEYVQPGLLREATHEPDFARQVGMLAALLYALDAVDCHEGNLVCDGRFPVLVDAETVLHPRTLSTADLETAWDQQDPLLGFDPSSVLRSGLLPLLHVDAQDRSFVVGGVDASGGAVAPTSAWTWKDRNSDAMALEWIEPAVGSGADAAHAPRAACCRHRGPLLDGFAAMYGLLHEEGRTLIDDGLIGDLARQERRFVPRRTAVYWQVMHRALAPAALRDGIDRSIELDALAGCWIGRADGQAFAEQECRSIERMDVPRFLVPSDPPALASRAAEDRIRGLNEVDYAQQKAILEESLEIAAGLDAPRAADSSSDASGIDFDEEARRIFDLLRVRAVPHERGGRTWIGATLNGSPRRCDVVPVPSGLYAGQGGIALFLSAIHALTGQGGDLAYDALKPLRSDAADAGRNGILGRSSVAYALLRCGQLLKDDALVASALDAALSVRVGSRTGDDDLVHGDAGTILTLLPIYLATRDGTLLSRLRLLGRRLRTAAAIDDAARFAGDRGPSDGFSHGATGRLLALLRLGEVLDDDIPRKPAMRSRADEPGAQAPDPPIEANDHRGSAHQSGAARSSWCHGPTGIGLARLHMREFAETPAGRRELEAAVETTQRFGAGPLDHLCCGTFGRVHFLAEAGRHLEDPSIGESAFRLAEATVHLARRNGGYRLLPGFAAGPFVPSFFQGLSGIGYALLRLGHPGALPDVLVLE